MKAWLEKKIEGLRVKKAKILKCSDASQDLEEVKRCSAELDQVNEEIREFEEQLKAFDVPPSSVGNFEPMKSYTVGGRTKTVEENEDDPYDTLNYRKAFRNYVLQGTPIPAELQKAAATTTTEDMGAVIPTTIMNKVIRKMTEYGSIFVRVTKTAVKGGVQIPKGGAKPKATWITAEGTTSEKQKNSITGYISFGYHKLQCKVAATLEAETIALPIFDDDMAKNIYEAMIVELEESIINGTGNGQPLGILKDTFEASQTLEMSAADLKSWGAWSKAFAKLPLSKRSGAQVILHNETWEGDILGMTDSTGQPVARVTVGLNGEDRPVFKGKEVIPLERYLPSFDSAMTGDIFGIVVNLADYDFNSNLQMTMKRYYDEDTDEWVRKATLIGDGKLEDTSGVLLLKKA